MTDPRTVLAEWCRDERAKLDAATARPWLDDLGFVRGSDGKWTIAIMAMVEHGVNAALIVSAVNAHAALVAFVEQALSSGCECSICLNGGRPYCEVEMQHMERLATLARDLGLLEEEK